MKISNLKLRIITPKKPLSSSLARSAKRRAREYLENRSLRALRTSSMSGAKIWKLRSDLSLQIAEQFKSWLE